MAGVVLAAGTGSRMGADGNKAFIPLAGRTLVSWSLNTMADVREISRRILVIRRTDQSMAEAVIDREVRGGPVELVVGGPSRHASESAALKHLAPSIEDGDVDYILLHDAARPLMSVTLARKIVAAAETYGAAIPVLSAGEIAQVTENGELNRTKEQLRFVSAQTPQCFKATALLGAYLDAEKDGFEGTDTSACFADYADGAVQSIRGESQNIKVTYPQDLFLAEMLLHALHYSLDRRVEDD